MIKTREHYELLLAKAQDRKILDLEDVQELQKTIEGLERVSRAVLTLDLMKAGLEGGSAQSIRKADMKLGTAMVALPDWLTGANHQ